MINFLKVVILSLQKGKLYLFLLFLTVFVFSIFLVLMLGIQNAIFRTVEENIAPKLPPDVVKVTPKIVPKGIFSGNIKGSVITEKDYIEIKRIKGIKRVLRVMEVPFPSSFVLSIFGVSARSDVPVYGVDTEIVSKDIAKGYSFKYAKGDKNIPFVVPRGAIEAYNLALSRGYGTPVVTEKTLLGLNFKFFAGKSSYKTLEKYFELSGVIVGISDNIPQISICMPIQAAISLTKEILPNYTPSYAILYIEVSSHQDIQRVVRELSKRGFIVETSLEKSNFVENIKKFISSIILGLVLIIGIFALVSVFISMTLFATTRIDFLYILRLLGASKIYIVILITVVMLVSTAISSFLGVLLSKEIFLNISSYLVSTIDKTGQFVKPEYFVLKTENLIFSVLLTTTLSLISSILISTRFVVKRI